MYFRRHRFRRLIALVALFGLLFQQVAMAAYSCPLELSGGSDEAAVATTTMPCHSPSATDKARCHQHCHPIAQTAGHEIASMAPALLPLAPWPHEFSMSRLTAPCAVARDSDARAAAPPLMIQFCTLQI